MGLLPIVPEPGVVKRLERLNVFTARVEAQGEASCEDKRLLAVMKRVLIRDISEELGAAVLEHDRVKRLIKGDRKRMPPLERVADDLVRMLDLCRQREYRLRQARVLIRRGEYDAAEAMIGETLAKEIRPLE